LWLVGGAAIASAATLQVGPGRTYTVPSAAATVAGNGDTIEIDAGEYVGEWIFTDVVDGRQRLLFACLVLAAALAALAGERSLVLFDGFETRDARFWSASLPEVPGTVCTPAATPVPLNDPAVLGNGSPGSVTRAQIQTALDNGGHITFDLGPAPSSTTTRRASSRSPPASTWTRSTP
jgi:hypothetical protein